MSVMEDLCNGHEFHFKCNKLFQRAKLVNQICFQNLSKPYTTFASQLIYLLHPFLHLTQLILNCFYLTYASFLMVSDLMLLNPFKFINRVIDSMYLCAAILLEFTAAVLSFVSNFTRTFVILSNGVYSLPQTETDDITLTIINGKMKAANLKSLDGSYYRRESGQNKTSKLFKEELRYHQEVLTFI